MTVDRDDEVTLTQEEFDKIPTSQYGPPSAVTVGTLYKRLVGTGWFIVECEAQEKSKLIVHHPRRVKMIT